MYYSCICKATTNYNTSTFQFAFTFFRKSLPDCVPRFANARCTRLHLRNLFYLLLTHEGTALLCFVPVTLQIYSVPSCLNILKTTLLQVLPVFGLHPQDISCQYSIIGWLVTIYDIQGQGSYSRITTVPTTMCLFFFHTIRTVHKMTLQQFLYACTCVSM
jgi:hypothetical protein